MKKIYLIKNLSPWMINELLAFSSLTPFRLILLRQPSSMYLKDIEKLKVRGVEVFVKPFHPNPDLRKTVFAFRFALRNIPRFWGIKNFVFAVKALYWFTKLKDGLITEKSSIHAQFATQASIIALLYKRYLKDVEYSFTFHAYDIYFKNRWFSFLVEESKISFAISKFSIKYINDNYIDIDENRLILSRLGTFIPKIYPNFEKMGKLQGMLVLGFLGTFVHEKNIFAVLKSMKDLVASGVWVKFFLAGYGPLEKSIKKFIVQHNLSEPIVLSGHIYGKEKEQFFKNIDVLILPSISEGLPVVLMEALSYGCPIISTNISGIPEICKNGYNGFLIPPDDVTALTDAILKFYYMDSEKFNQFRRNASESSREYDIVRNSRLKLKSMMWI